MWRWTVSPEDAPDKAEYVELSYKKGDIVAHFSPNQSISAGGGGGGFFSLRELLKPDG
jgi:hypothetical protein